MMTRFHDARVKVQVYNVVVGIGIPQENFFEVVFFQFAPTVAGAFDTHAQTKKFKVTNIWLESVISFVGSLLHNSVYQPIMQVDRME
jgi:hypothetical protein